MQIPKYDAQITDVKVRPQPDGLGQAVAGFGEVLTEEGAMFVTKLRENREATQFAKAQVDLKTRYDQFRLELEKEPDYLKYPEMYERFQRQAFGEVQNGISENNAKQAFQRWGDETRVAQSDEVNWLSYKKETQDQIASYENDIDYYVSIGDNNSVIARTEAAKEGALLLPHVANGIQNKALHQIAKNTVLKNALDMPILDAEKYVDEYVEDPSDPRHGLTPLERDQIKDAARQEDAFQTHREEVAHNKKVEDYRVELIKALDRGLRGKKNPLTREMIHAGPLEDERDSEEIVYWYDRLGRMMDAITDKKSAKDDPFVYADAVKIVANWEMSKDDKKKKLEPMLMHGLLPNTWLSLMEKVKNDDDLPDAGVHSGYQLFDKYWNVLIKKAEDDKDFQKVSDYTVQKATALRQYMELLQKHPEWTPKQKEEVARNMNDTPRRKVEYLFFQEPAGKALTRLGGEGRLLGIEDTESVQKLKSEYVKEEFEKKKERDQKLQMTIQQEIFKSERAQQGGPYTDISGPFPSGMGLDIKRRAEAEKRAAELAAEWIPIRDFPYSDGSPGREVVNRKTGEKRNYIYKNDEWSIGPNAPKDVYTEFREQVGPIDEQAVDGAGNVALRRGTKWYVRNKEGKWVIP